MSLINTQVQPFKTTAFVNRGGKGEFIEVSDESLKGKWSVLIFMPAAFTFNCPTEIEDAAEVESGQLVPAPGMPDAGEHVEAGRDVRGDGT